MQQHDVSMQTALSTQPVPEFWCSVAYFELDTQASHQIHQIFHFYFI